MAKGDSPSLTCLQIEPLRAPHVDVSVFLAIHYECLLGFGISSVEEISVMGSKLKMYKANKSAGRRNEEILLRCHME
jgi:hypothetical protein